MSVYHSYNLSGCAAVEQYSNDWLKWRYSANDLRLHHGESVLYFRCSTPGQDMMITYILQTSPNMWFNNDHLCRYHTQVVTKRSSFRGEVPLHWHLQAAIWFVLGVQWIRVPLHILLWSMPQWRQAVQDNCTQSNAPQECTKCAKTTLEEVLNQVKQETYVVIISSFLLHVV